MNLKEIVDKAYKEARRKTPNRALAARCIELNYPVELELRSIREKFMDRFVVYTLELLNKISAVYPSESSKQYRELLFYALKDNGAIVLDFMGAPGTEFPVIGFGDLHYIVRCLKDGAVFSTRNTHDSINVSADPWIVAKLMAMIHAYPVADTIYEEIYNESCALYKMSKIMESSVHQLIDDILEDKKFYFNLTLCGTNKFKLELFDGIIFVADIYTDLKQVRKDVQNAINHYKQNFRPAYK